MAPLAISLGPTPPDPHEAARVPWRARVGEVLLKDKQLPAHHIYVGRGHHSHRLRTTIWKSPVTPGHDCPHEEWISLYVQHVCSNEALWKALPSLQGKTLVCDCAWQDLCEADLLQAWFSKLQPQPRWQHERPPLRKPGFKLVTW